MKKKKKIAASIEAAILVEEGGFEPPKRYATDLQSAPFGHSGTPPYSVAHPMALRRGPRKAAKRLFGERRDSGASEQPAKAGCEGCAACPDAGAGGRT